MNVPGEPQWLSDAERAEVIDVLMKVACVPTAWLAMVDAEAIEEAQELCDRLRRHADQSTERT